ncbi:hypothetical protein Pla52n_61800 [Stieleria varia]|uniref:Uncharacterized protein n=1 Tax=Stieleria varia TaxID=2528005 RepID=A0A5C6A088_9BACT|nr:hypothetical protein Pla52n_61800 [Stieleria varia]
MRGRRAGLGCGRQRLETEKRLAGYAIDLESRATIVVRLFESKTNTTIRFVPLLPPGLLKVWCCVFLGLRKFMSLLPAQMVAPVSLRR